MVVSDNPNYGKPGATISSDESQVLFEMDLTADQLIGLMYECAYSLKGLAQNAVEKAFARD
jgi:hypothetical protein